MEERIPRGALAFLTEADKNFMYTLILMLKALEHTLSTTSETTLELPGGGYALSIHPSKERNVEWSAAEKVGSTPYKMQFDLNDTKLSQPRIDRMITVCYLEALFSYWFTNNSIGRIRKRMNFRAKLETIPTVITSTYNEKRAISRLMGTVITGNILNPNWQDAALAGLVLAHLYVQRESINRDQNEIAELNDILQQEAATGSLGAGVRTYYPS